MKVTQTITLTLTLFPLLTLNHNPTANPMQLDPDPKLCTDTNPKS